MIYGLTFAGIPFVSDTARIIRQPAAADASSTTPPDQLLPRKHQSNADLIDEINRLIDIGEIRSFENHSKYPGRNLGAIAYTYQERLTPDVPIGQWRYPTGARRWSVFRGLATSSQAKDMLAATGGRTPKTFAMKAVPQGARLRDGLGDSNYTLSSSMYLLPPHPLAEHGGKYDGLFLITLVDERFYWSFIRATIKPDRDSTWSSLITTVGTALGVTITTSTIATAYSTPELDSQLWTNAESAPALLDSIADNLSRVVVRKLDGTYNMLTTAESQTRVLSNRGNVNQLRRMAGGDLFSSGTKLPAGNLMPARNAVVPQNVAVTFPYYVVGDDPVPHFLNTRYNDRLTATAQRPSCWYEESYGGVYNVTVGIASGGSTVSGLVGVASGHTIHTTAKALVSGENQVGSPLNASGLTALAMQIAGDYYDGQTLVALDEVYHGTYAWTPEGIHDIIWTYSDRKRQASTRVLRSAEWNQAVAEMQHAAPALSGQTTITKGVGGPSVPQTWRDTTTVAGTTQLQAALNSGGQTATFAAGGGFPQSNRWKGRINSGLSDHEDCLFEGASGGTSVGVVYRAIDNTLPSSHNSGAVVTQLIPNTTYGVNLVTLEGGNTVFPGTWTSGGVQEVRLNLSNIGGGTTLAVRAVTSAPISLSGYTVAGDTLTGSVNGVLTVDGVTPSAGDVVLLNRESNPIYNGPYKVVQVGSASTTFILQQYNATLIQGQLVAVGHEGTQYGCSMYKLAPPQGTVPIVRGTTELYYHPPGPSIKADYATTGALPSYTRNGTTGVLTGTGTGALTVDGYTLTSADYGRAIFVRGETGANAAYNQTYQVRHPGDGSTAYSLVPSPRSYDNIDITGGATLKGVVERPVLGQTTPVLGTTPQAYIKKGGVGAFPKNIAGPAPIHHWPMDEGSNNTIYDRVSAGTNGTNNGASWTAGKLPGRDYLYDYHLDFDGVNDYVDLNSAAGILRTHTDWSISCWIRPDTLSAQQYVYFEGNTATTSWIGLAFDAATPNRIQIGLRRNTATAVVVAASTTEMRTGEWYHVVALLVNGTTLQIYVDDTFEGQATVAGLPTETFDFSRIGGAHNGITYTFFFDGSISDFMMF